MAYTTLIGPPWYWDLLGTFSVLILGWFCIGIRVGKIPEDRQTGNHEALFDTDRATATWHGFLLVTTLLFWPAPVMIAVGTFVIWGIIIAATAVHNLGEKAGGISQARKELRRKKAALVAEAQKTNDAFLKERLEALEKEWKAYSESS